MGIILIAVAFTNAFIDFYQQFKTSRLLESFLDMVPSETTVIRNQTLQTVSTSKVVLGDIVFIKAGDKVPADLRLFNVNDLKLDNSSITGESEAQEKNTAVNGNRPVLEATNLAFSGTSVCNGEGYGIVIRTGEKSVLGQIARLTIGEKTPSSQLSKEINIFVRIIAAIAIITAIIFFIVGILLGYNIGITFSFAIGIFVAYVPQGLPVTVSVLIKYSSQEDLYDFFLLIDAINYCCKEDGQEKCSCQKSTCCRNTWIHHLISN